MDSLGAKVFPRGDAYVIALSGRLDETFEDVLQSALRRLVDQGRVRVVIDLGGLAYLNSRGVSVFIAAVDDLREAGGDLKLAGAPAQARLVLDRLGVDRLLQGFPTVDEAIDAFKVPIEEFLARGGLGAFIAGPKAKTFHVSGCAKAKRMKNVRTLTSRKEAREAGLSPCPSCL